MMDGGAIGSRLGPPRRRIATPDEVGATLAAFAQALVAALMPGPEGAAALERLANELHEIATEAPVDSDGRLIASEA